MTDKILILDFGSQVTQLIARRVRECGVYSDIRPFNMSDSDITAFGAKAIILSGGPASVHEAHSPRISRKVFELGVPVLGICYGQQLMCDVLGGKVESSDHREFGRAEVHVEADCALFTDVWQVGDNRQVWMSHGDRVTSVPSGFKVVADTPSAPFAAIANDEKRFYGLQFHPEVMHTPDGAKLIGNFVNKVAGCKSSWTMAAFRQRAIERVRAQVGKKRVLCAVSGGVDSAVVAGLLHEAIGDQVACIFIDTGLLRMGEGAQVEKLFRDHFKMKLIHVDASMIFLSRLAGVPRPEQAF